MDSTHKEISKMWREHIKFNRWEVKKDEHENDRTSLDKKYIKMNIEDISFL